MGSDSGKSSHPNPSIFKDEDEGEDDNANEDYLVSYLRKGMHIIKSHARESLLDCETESSRLDMQQRMEKSTLKMLKAEHTCLNHSRVISQVVEEMVEEEGNDDSGEQVIFKSDFLKDMPFHERTMQVFSQRFSEYQDSLTDEKLRKDDKFRSLQREIQHGLKDGREKDAMMDQIPGPAGDGHGPRRTTSSSCTKDNNSP